MCIYPPSIIEIEKFFMHNLAVIKVSISSHQFVNIYMQPPASEENRKNAFFSAFINFTILGTYFLDYRIFLREVHKEVDAYLGASCTIIVLVISPLMARNTLFCPSLRLLLIKNRSTHK